MEITAKVMLHVRLADGRTIHVAHEVDRRTGDNPRYAAGEALEALTEAQTALLRGFAAQLGQDAPEAAPEPPPVNARFAAQRDYVLRAMDVAKVPLDADAARIRSMLLDAGLDVNADDTELESFQAMRPTPSDHQLDGVGRIVALLDQFGAGNIISVADAKEIVKAHGADPVANDAEWREAVRVRTHARKDPER